MADVLLTNFNFEVSFDLAAGDGPDRLGDGGFQEVSGLEVEMDVAELLEGGRHDGVIRRVGRAKYQPLVCKRGMFRTGGGTLAEPELWQWFQDIVGGRLPVRRYSGHRLGTRPEFGDLVATWRFTRALPAKLVGPQLNAKSGEIAIEELHLHHEGLFLEGTT